MQEINKRSNFANKLYYTGIVIMIMEYKVLDSLHRPFHRPIWIVKWVCYFILLRSKNPNKYIQTKEETADFYFILLEWLHTNYPQDSDGIPSKESVDEVWNYFLSIDFSNRENKLREIISKSREKGIETKIYSTYKASSYYLNLADDKLHFLNNTDSSQNWQPKQLTKRVLKSGISTNDRKIYIWHILQNDGHFFLSMCLLYKPIARYELKMESEIFKFMQRYYPMANFDYTRQSHSNYYVVRKRWIELLQIINEKGHLSSILTNIIMGDRNLEKVFRDVECKVKEYSLELRKRGNFIKQKKVFISIYQKYMSKTEDKSNFVHLYDICKEMKMSYEKFQIFLTLFYQEERLVRNIFFINIVSTIEQRKRFYIGNTPVMKIKITKNYGI